MTTIYYFDDGSLCQVSAELASRLIADRKARLATASEAHSYLRQIEQDDARSLACEESMLHGDSGPSQPGYDY